MKDVDLNFQFSQPSPTVEVFLPGNRVIRGPRGACIADFFRVLPEWSAPPIVGAVINGELRELTYPIDMDSRVKPVTMADSDGARIYRRSITFLLEAAFEELYPDESLTVDHSVSSGGFFCQVVNKNDLTEMEISLLENRMKEIVEQDLPFERNLVPLAEAVEYFQKNNNFDKVRLLKYRTKDHLVLYKLGHHQDYHHGYMVPSTGYLKLFHLQKLGDGFVLH